MDSLYTDIQASRKTYHISCICQKMFCPTSSALQISPRHSSPPSSYCALRRAEPGSFGRASGLPRQKKLLQNRVGGNSFCLPLKVNQAIRKFNAKRGLPQTGMFYNSPFGKTVSGFQHAEFCRYTDRTPGENDCGCNRHRRQDHPL